MKKSEIALKITRKNIDKVYDILAMFNEKVPYDKENQLFYTETARLGMTGSEKDDYWCMLEPYDDKKIVKPNHLKQILFKEHAKKGDVIIGECCGEQFILEFDKFLGDYINSKKWIRPSNGEVYDSEFGGSFDKFIRFATEEEKALLYPVELETGKWYKSLGLGTLCLKQGVHNCGFFMGKWNTLICCQTPSEWIEATTEEVEQALIKEAKKRYKIGDKLSKIHEDISKGSRVFNLDISYHRSDRTLWFTNDQSYLVCIFKDGKWAEVIKESSKIWMRRNDTIKKFPTTQKHNLEANGWTEVKELV